MATKIINGIRVQLTPEQESELEADAQILEQSVAAIRAQEKSRADAAKLNRNRVENILGISIQELKDIINLT